MDEYRVHAHDANGRSVYLVLDRAPHWSRNWREATTSDDASILRAFMENALDTFRELASGLTREPRIVNRGKFPKKEASA